MDFRYATRPMKLAVPHPSLDIHVGDSGENDKALQCNKCNDSTTVVQLNDSFAHKMCNPDHFFTSPGRDARVAGMKIFAAIILNAWRKRCDEVKRLMDEVADLKRVVTKAKNQLHVFNSLFRLEQKRNDDLNFQLKRSFDNVNRTKSSNDGLTTSLISLKADKALLEQQLQVKEQEFESINILLTQTKSELFRSMKMQRELHALLSAEQRKIQTMENQKYELINEICELNSGALQKEEYLCKEIKEKDDQFAALKKELKAAEDTIKILKQSIEQQLRESDAREACRREVISSLENELKTAQTNMGKTITHRLKNFWNSSLVYRKLTLQMLHLLAYYALPAMPPPEVNTLPLVWSLD